MAIVDFLRAFQELIAGPAIFIFFGTAVLLTFKTGFIQFRMFGKFVSLIKKGFEQRNVQTKQGANRAINSFHALFAAMATTIGMGNLVGPPIAVIFGGPGALFWLLVYIFFASVTKFTEVVFSVKTRETMPDGQVVGGPMQYLKAVHPLLASWYVGVMMFLFVSWSTIQSNALSKTLEQEGIPVWVTGLVLVLITYATLRGGAQRVGLIASKLVPFMFAFYVTFSFYLILMQWSLFVGAVKLILHSAFSSSAAIGGFFGATVMQAMRAGIYKGIFTTEAGVGTSAIAHAVADVDHPTDQGILAMYSMISDALLSMISGVLVIMSGIWTIGECSSTLLYEVFTQSSPMFGRPVLLVTIVLFVVTTVIGNSFNGRQTFASLTKFRWVSWYVNFSMLMIFVASMVEAKLVWSAMDFLLPLVAIPNLIGLVILAFREPEALRVK